MAELSLADLPGSVPEPIVNTRQSGDIQTIAVQHGYTVEDVPGDGNCVFFGHADRYERIGHPSYIPC